MKELKWIHAGLITESLPNGMFRVHLDNAGLILGYVSGKIRISRNLFSSNKSIQN